MQQTKQIPSRQRSSAADRVTRAAPAAGFTDNRPTAIAQRRLAEAIENSPQAVTQRALSSAMHYGSYGTAQRKRLDRMFGGAAQLAAGQEEDLLQGKFSPVQRQGTEYQELLQGKFAPVQREGGPEEEEMLQGKSSPVQRQDLEGEKLLQGKFDSVQRQGGPEEVDLLQGKFVPVQRAESGSNQESRENNTGLPDNLKAGIESISGISLDNVKVHYNSAQPAQLNALAYAQGTDIHVAPGQEQHLPHEAWHVVQQAQGRVQPTMQMKDGVPVNDDAGLEHEADEMGERANAGVEQSSWQKARPEHNRATCEIQPAAQQNQGRVSPTTQRQDNVKRSTSLSKEVDVLRAEVLQQKVKPNTSPTIKRPSIITFEKAVHQLAPVVNDRLNVIGEDHEESAKRIETEKNYLKTAAGGDGYWDETTFKVGELNRSIGSLIDRRQKGDPSWLHMEYLMSGLVHNLEVNLRKSQNGHPLSKATHKDEHLWCWDSMIIFNDGVGKYIQDRFFDLSELQVNKLREARAEFNTAEEKMTALNNAVNTGIGLTKNISDAHVAVQAYANKVYGAIRAMGDVERDREISMHNAANAGSHLKGAWKIGEDHVQHFLDPSKSPTFDNKQYNVTTKAEFDKELPK